MSAPLLGFMVATAIFWLGFLVRRACDAKPWLVVKVIVLERRLREKDTEISMLRSQLYDKKRWIRL